MTGPDISLSVFKRRSASIDDVQAELEDGGFSSTGSVLDGRVRYQEDQNGFNVTLVDGPFGTLVLPSGPIRGALFGNDAVGLDSVNRGGDSSSTNDDDDSSMGRGSTSERNVVA